MLTIMKASAGSGKTYNLARKYIVLLLKNRDRSFWKYGGIIISVISVAFYEAVV